MNRGFEHEQGPALAGGRLSPVVGRGPSVQKTSYGAYGQPEQAVSSQMVDYYRVLARYRRSLA
ncbi:MAG TPA: hypothetical protein VGD62_05385, partial [Acidobacteriaceae bacterium]